MIAHRTAIKNHLLAGEVQAQELEKLGDPLQKIAQIVDFRALAEKLDRVAPRPVQEKGDRSPIPRK